MPNFRRPLLIAVASLAFAGVDALQVTVADPVTPRVALTNHAAGDQDDLCIWLHPTNPALSTFIVSDKSARRLFVYEMDGTLLQELSVPGKPGNIDIRHDVPVTGGLADIVAYNDRDASTLVILAVDRTNRTLRRIDRGALATGENYGLTLYRSPIDGGLYAFTTSRGGSLRQFRLQSSNHTMTSSLVRSWSVGSITEGCVADDETGQIYFGEENLGIWKFGAEPQDPTEGMLIARVGDTSGLEADVEGLTLYYAASGGGYLLASGQGGSTFHVYGRAAPHRFVTSFTITDVRGTDGIDVINVNLGPSFPYGVFAAHNDGASPKPIVVCAYEDLGLSIDTDYWDPRRTGSTARRPRSWGVLKSMHRRGSQRSGSGSP